MWSGFPQPIPYLQAPACLHSHSQGARVYILARLQSHSQGARVYILACLHSPSQGARV